MLQIREHTLTFFSSIVSTFKFTFEFSKEFKGALVLIWDLIFFILASL
jgi:hypothetical protein